MKKWWWARLTVVFQCLAHCVTVHFALGSSWLCSHGPELCSGAETPSSFLLTGLVSPRAFLQGSFANPGTDGCLPKAGRCFGGAALWLLPFLPPCSWRWPEQRAVPGQAIRGVVAVAEPAPQPAERRPALAPAAQPDRGVPGEPRVPLISSQFWVRAVAPEDQVQQGLQPFPAAACCHRPALPLATEVLWVSATQQHLCWHTTLFSLLCAPYTFRAFIFCREPMKSSQVECLFYPDAALWHLRFH